MNDKLKTFVSDHKSHLATAVIAAAVGGAVVFVYFNKKTFLHVPKDVLAKMAAAPEEVWVSYEANGVLLGMTAIKIEVH
jgi:hypothetical protein